MLKRLAFSISEVAIWESRLTVGGIVSCLVMLLIYLQVIKTFSKNVEGCRDGSAKNHRN